MQCKLRYFHLKKEKRNLFVAIFWKYFSILISSIFDRRNYNEFKDTSENHTFLKIVFENWSL